MAAVYLDGGFKAAFEVIERHFSHAVSQVGNRLAVEDFKSQLQEYAQGKFRLVPRYRVVRETGPDHDKTFEVSLAVGDFLTTFGIGKSKKAAEQNAACMALEKLQERFG